MNPSLAPHTCIGQGDTLKTGSPTRLMHRTLSQLRLARLQRGLSQTELAELAGVSQTYVSALERGLQPTRSSLPKRIAAELGIPEASLFG